jgi:hypothetical protein
MNNRKQQTDTPKPKDARPLALAPAREVSPPPDELQRTWRQERERRELEANNEEEDASLDEERRPGAVAVPAVFTGPTRPPALSEPRGPSAFDQQSLIVAELAEASQEEEELRRRNHELEQADEEHRRQNKEHRRRLQEFENIVNGAVQGTVIVENSAVGDHDQPFGRKERRFWRRTRNSGAGDHDQNAAPSPGDHDQNPASSPFGRKGRRFWIGAAFALLLVVGVILGVVIPLTNNKDNDSVVCTTRLDCLAKILLQNEVADADALQDESSPQFLALRGLANEDNALLDLDSTPTVIIVERYVLAVLYFATIAEGGSNLLNFLNVSSVCGLNEVSCNGDDLVIALDLGKSKHGEVIVLISENRD